MPSKQIRLSQVLLTYPQCEYPKEELLSWLKTLKDYECSVVSHEVHEKTGGDHLHAWLKLKQGIKVVSNTLQHMFDWKDKHPNIELVKNTQADKVRVIKYVIEDGDYIVDNCNLDALLGKTKERKYNTKEILETPMEQLVETGAINPRDYRNIKWAQEDWAERQKPMYTKNTKGIWLWGDAGVGKTKFCEQFGEYVGSWYEKTGPNKFWHQYEGQEVVVINEVRENSLITSGYLFKWADNSPTHVETKGGMKWARHRYLLVTSNCNPQDLCCDYMGNLKPDLWEPLKRRFRIIECRKANLPEDSPYVKFCPNSVFDNPWCTLKDIVGDPVGPGTKEWDEQFEDVIEEEVSEPPSKQPPTDDPHEE